MNRGVPHGTLVGRRVYVSGERNKQGWSPAGESRVDPRGASLAAANRDPRRFDDPNPLARVKPAAPP
jgi:hypothetical protein